jgi:hypothetical protein
VGTQALTGLCRGEMTLRRHHHFLTCSLVKKHLIRLKVGENQDGSWAAWATCGATPGPLCMPSWDCLRYEVLGGSWEGKTGVTMWTGAAGAAPVLLGS